jgi:hypothetical protein
VTIEVATCASVAENDRFQWQVYPNPAKDQVHLRWDAQYQAEWVRLKDLQGREITRMVPGEAGQASLPTATLPRGLYLLEISLNNTLLTQKIVLQ